MKAGGPHVILYEFLLIYAHFLACFPPHTLNIKLWMCETVLFLHDKYRNLSSKPFWTESGQDVLLTFSEGAPYNWPRSFSGPALSSHCQAALWCWSPSLTLVLLQHNKKLPVKHVPSGSGRLFWLGQKLYKTRLVGTLQSENETKSETFTFLTKTEGKTLQLFNVINNQTKETVFFRNGVNSECWKS